MFCLFILRPHSEFPCCRQTAFLKFWITANYYKFLCTISIDSKHFYATQRSKKKQTLENDRKYIKEKFHKVICFFNFGFLPSPSGQTWLMAVDGSDKSVCRRSKFGKVSYKVHKLRDETWILDISHMLNKILEWYYQ